MLCWNLHISHPCMRALYVLAVIPARCFDSDWPLRQVLGLASCEVKPLRCAATKGR